MPLVARLAVGVVAVIVAFVVVGFLAKLIYLAVVFAIVAAIAYGIFHFVRGRRASLSRY